jgi:hypothetical protein
LPEEETGKARQNLAAVVLPVLQGKGMARHGGLAVRQRNLSADLIFWLLLYQDKSNSHRGN